MDVYDVVVLGAGAAGLMCAIEAGRRGRRVLVIDHARAAGEKIRISGGGRCNFTNLRTTHDHFLSDNPQFCISALRRFTPNDFVTRIEQAGISFHEKALGQLFCDGSARQVVDLLLRDLQAANAQLRLATRVLGVEPTDRGFVVDIEGGRVVSHSLVVATGGRSVPKMGATGLGYDIAARFGVRVTSTRPGLVPFTLSGALQSRSIALAGVSLQARAAAREAVFDEGLLFTHRGLSGPAVLQISSYWNPGDEVLIDLAPGVDTFGILRAARREKGRTTLAVILADYVPKRLAEALVEEAGVTSGSIADLPDRTLRAVADAISAWRFRPSGTEGWRTAEVTIGGVDTRDLDSRTMEARKAPGLYFIGEVVDVTGWLGGYNFQWAWSSGWCAGQVA